VEVLLSAAEASPRDPLRLARARRAAGRVAAAERRWADAEAALSEAADDFLHHDHATLEALTRIDLAGVRAARGADPSPVAADLDPGLAGVELNAGQLVTLFVFRDACRDRTLTPAHARDLGDRLERQGAARTPWPTALP
jgi:hypothetical protein